MGVTAEVDRIAGAGLPSTDKTGWAQLTAAFPSADQLLDEIQVGDQTQQRCFLLILWADAACLDYCTLCCSSAARESRCHPSSLAHRASNTVQRM